MKNLLLINRVLKKLDKPEYKLSFNFIVIKFFEFVNRKQIFLIY